MFCASPACNDVELLHPLGGWLATRDRSEELALGVGHRRGKGAAEHCFPIIPRWPRVMRWGRSRSRSLSCAVSVVRCTSRGNNHACDRIVGDIGLLWDGAMEDELFTMMLTAVFAAVMLVSGQAFIDHRNRAEAAAFLSSLAVSQALAAPR
jgi:hypothetical protein